MIQYEEKRKLNLSDWLAVLEWRRQPEPRYPGLMRGHIRRWSDAPVTTFIFSMYDIPLPCLPSNCTSHTYVNI